MSCEIFKEKYLSENLLRKTFEKARQQKRLLQKEKHNMITIGQTHPRVATIHTL